MDGSPLREEIEASLTASRSGAVSLDDAVARARGRIKEVQIELYAGDRADASPVHEEILVEPRANCEPVVERSPAPRTTRP